MRPIEFRYFDRKDKTYTYSKEMSLEGFFAHFENTFDGILEQFTGLLDAEGKKIFEGDILRFESANGLRVIDIMNSEFKESCGCCNSIYGYEVPIEGSVIIGNIHQNPELLENK